ncbi:hypothetical protein FQN50_003330 [Emmonsiellopsis sp. PD_5]|nr:hypothetical protein FQN50_003330 [Emmonsiellopsis sp. PD_5]
MDDSNNEANRGRGKNRVTTRSRGRKEGPKDRSKVGVSSSLTSAPIGNVCSAEDANLEQLGEPTSGVPSELALRTPTTLSRTPAFSATSISLKDGSSRSRSPTKTMGDLKAARPPIKVGIMREAPEAIRELRHKFKFDDICGGIGVLPHSLKAQLNAIDDVEYHTLFFDDSTTSTISDDLEVFQKLQSIQNAASKCDMLMKPEPSWGEEVFRPMLSLAVELENRESDQEVQVENVTTAQIFPGSLVPAGLQNLPFMSKRVGYCIYLSQTDPQETHTRDILAMRDIDIDDYSINQAGSSDYIKWLPQLAAVECKKTPSGTDGTVQLGVWMAALRKRLEGLMKRPDQPGAHLKPMPCLKVEGLGEALAESAGEETESPTHRLESFSPAAISKSIDNRSIALKRTSRVSPPSPTLAVMSGSNNLVARPLEGKFGIVTGGSRGKVSPAPHYISEVLVFKIRYLASRINKETFLTNSTGIGAAIAENLASKGCSLLLNYTSPTSTEPTLELCEKLTKEHSIRCISVQADLSDPAPAVDQILASAKNHFTSAATNTLTIDILINNAGIAGDKRLNDPVRGPIESEQFNRIYAVNVLAPLLLTQAVAPYLPKDRSGRIINLSSVSSSLGFEGQSIYGGTKAAIEAMTRTWARELGDRATVNAINPGPVIGDMYWKTGEDFWKIMQGWQDNAPGSKIVVPEGFSGTGTERLSEENRKLVVEKMGGRRPAYTDEIAGVVGMLCTKDGQWCTGSVVCANGGLRMSV